MVAALDRRRHDALGVDDDAPRHGMCEHRVEECFVRRRDGGTQALRVVDGQRRLGRGHQEAFFPVEQGAQDVVLVVVALVQHRLAHAGPRGDGGHGRAAVALGVPDGEGGVEHQRTADGRPRWAARVAAAGRDMCGPPVVDRAGDTAYRCPILPIGRKIGRGTSMSTSTRLPVVDAMRGKADAGLQTFGEMIVMAHPGLDLRRRRHRARAASPGGSSWSRPGS